MTAYRVQPGAELVAAAYAISVLRAIAEGDQPQNGETPAEYAERHLRQMETLGYTTDFPSFDEVARAYLAGSEVPA